MLNTFRITAITGLFLIGCTKDFEEMNTNPNLFTDPNIDLVFPFVISNMAVETNFDVLRRHGGAYGQYYANLQATTYDLFNQVSGQYMFYRYILHAEYIIEKAKEKNYDNRLGAALVLKAFMYSKLTDEMGDIPYFKALSPGESLSPPYDSQEDIYMAENGLLDILDQANTLLSSRVEGIGADADILYAGNIIKWRKFANSLRLRLLIRVSNKVNVDSKIAEMVNNPDKYPMFADNSDNAELQLLVGSTSSSSPLGVSANLGDTYYKERAASATIVDVLKAYNDPRLQAYFEPTPNDPSVYVGIPAGILSPATYNGGPNFYSRLSAKFGEDANPYVPAKLMQYSEVMFLLAEAAQRGIIGGSAKDYYDKGIAGSMDFWDIPMPAGYMDQAVVAYNGTLKQIITQKWLANFCVGNEAWFDYRRTGFPDFVIGDATLLNGEYVQRLMYPDGEETYNRTSLDEAIARQGPDEMATKMWYLK